MKLSHSNYYSVTYLIEVFISFWKVKLSYGNLDEFKLNYASISKSILIDYLTPYLYLFISGDISDDFYSSSLLLNFFKLPDLYSPSYIAYWTLIFINYIVEFLSLLYSYELFYGLLKLNSYMILSLGDISFNLPPLLKKESALNTFYSSLTYSKNLVIIILFILSFSILSENLGSSFSYIP